jgi:hypothetical protein
LRAVVTHFVTHGERGDGRNRLERGPDPLAGERRVGVPVELVTELGVLVAALDANLRRREADDLVSA